MASRISNHRLRDRREGGALLAERLRAYAHRPDVIVLALPRGGVPVAYEIAVALDVPLDVYAVRKLGVPGHEELAMGAIASDGTHLLNEDVVAGLQITREDILAVIERERRELERRVQLYRDHRPRPQLTGKTVILVDDGLATGASMAVAIAALRRTGPARIVAAVPIGSASMCRELRRQADEVICDQTPEPFYSVGAWYDNFEQTSDDEVRALLAAAAARDQPSAG
jgi:predicted phosphoribosyltransferase